MSRFLLIVDLLFVVEKFMKILKKKFLSAIFISFIITKGEQVMQKMLLLLKKKTK